MLAAAVVVWLLACVGVAAAAATGDDVWVLQIADKIDPNVVGRELGLRYLHRVPSPAHMQMYAFKRDQNSRESIQQISALADSHPAVEWAERQVGRQQTKRAKTAQAPSPQPPRHPQDKAAYRPTDPLYGSQWHLQPASPVRLTTDECWRRGPDFRGKKAIVSIVDDGLQWMHGDLRPNYEATVSHDYNANDADPSPSSGDGHGTSASGVAAATASNNICGTGVCPECKVAGVRLIAGPSTDYMEAMGLSHGSERVAVYSNSWGPVDDGKTMEGPGRVTLAALEHNSLEGRDGKGSLYVWAGGNGAGAQDDGNYDGYANSRFTIAVGAVAHDGRRAYYSEPCACLMVSAPSSGQRGYGITTTDLMGYDGYSSGDCTSDFGGTSSAAPAAAGAIGLLLGLKPALTRRDVLMLLATTSNRLLGVDHGSSDWTPLNSRGVSHNHEYGWGMIDPEALTRVADTYVAGSTPPELVCSTGRIVVNRALGDGVGSAATFPMELPNVKCLGTPSAAINYVEYVEVRIWLSHRRRGDMAIQLADPHGVVSRLATPHNDDNVGYNRDNGWLFGSARHWGQTFSGAWTLSVGDMVRNGRAGTLEAYEIIVRGHKETPRTK